MDVRISNDQTIEWLSANPAEATQVRVEIAVLKAALDMNRRQAAELMRALGVGRNFDQLV